MATYSSIQVYACVRVFNKVLEYLEISACDACGTRGSHRYETFQCMDLVNILQKHLRLILRRH